MKKTIVFLLVFSLLIMSFAACSKYSDNGSKQDEASNAGAAYADKLFDVSFVHTVNITISEDDWTDLQENPTDKTKYHTDITIDGETIKDVSFATKGNTSLTAVAANENSNRYSFKVNFGKYVDGQTYYGLNKLNLNNIYADATYMKDYFSYEIFRQAGVSSPLVSYVWLTINGEDHGLYIAIEDVSESYLERTANGEGELYKPETEQLADMGNGGRPDGMPDGEMSTMPDGAAMPDPGANAGNGQNSPPDMQGNTPPDGSGENMPTPSNGAQQPQGNPDFNSNMAPNGEMPALPEGETMPEQGVGMPGGNGVGIPGENGVGMPGENGGFGSDANGADLKYTDDSIDSYSDIFDNDETDADDESKARVIAALKALSTGEDLEDYIDTDEVIRYFAAHNFVLNYDSYTGNMLHNYYLYESNGKLSMLPWDYNLAFGAFAGGGEQGGVSDATDLVNAGIDTPLFGPQESDRPMWSWIASNEEYLEQYHQVYDEFLKYFESGDFDAEIDRLYEMLLPYVEKDPSAFYTVDEFRTAYGTLKQFCNLRAESIRKQLDGTLSTKTDEQNSADRVDASSVTVSDMGTHDAGKNMPGNMGGGPGGTPPGGSSENVIYDGDTEITSAVTQTGKTYSSSTADQSALLISTSDNVTISNATVTKSGDSNGGDNCNFYGQNAAVLVKDGTTTTITGATITSDAAGANGVFCYGGNGGQNGASGDGTTLIIKDTTITTTGSGSGGIMTTGGGVTKAYNLTVTTSGQSSAPIRTDRGGGTVTVDGGTYTSNGLGSPAIYSTADITVSNAKLVSNLSEGVCIEGLNSITLTDCDLTANNTKRNGNATFLDSIMIYQSMSGDAASGTSSFTMTGGSLTSKSGHVFHVTNTNAVITLSGVKITNSDSANVLLSVCDDGWSGGSNTATLNASKQTLTGAVLVGSNSKLTLNLSDSSSFKGYVNGKITNASGETVSTEVGTVNVTLDSSSTWTLTGDSYVTSFTGSAANVISNGYTLYVNGVALAGTN